MKNRNSIIIVAVTALILMVPLVAMQFTEEVDWKLFDFVIIGALLLGTGFTYELTARKVENTTHRVMLGVVVAAVMLLIWADLAVGIFNIPGISGS